MEQNCLNCYQVVAAQYCGNCGQKVFRRIDNKYVLDEIQETVFHTNKGFLYTLKRIVKNPGKTARNFIDGTRVNHYKPILLVFVLSGISTFISFKVLGLRERMNDYYAGQNMASEFSNDFMNVFAGYNSIFMLLLIPLFALFTKLGFRRWGHNYYEHIIMNCYILSFYIILSITIISPIMYLFIDDFATVIRVSTIFYLAVPFILFWFFKSFYAERPVKKVIGRVLATTGWTISGFILMFIFLIIAAFIFAIINGPAAQEYFVPK